MDGAGTEEEREPEGLECNDKEDTVLNTVHFVIDAEDFGGHDTGSSVLSAFQFTAIKENVKIALGTEDGFSPLKIEEEDGSYFTVQAVGLTSGDSESLDIQLDIASVCGQMSDFLSDMKALTPPSVVEFAREPAGQSGSYEECEGHYSDGLEEEAKKKKSTDRSGMCAEKASSGIPEDLCRQDVCGPATCQSSQHASTSAAAQQSCRVSSRVLESGSNHDGTRGKKEFLENPEIPQPARKKSRTFYSAEQLEELEKMFKEDRYPDSEKRKEIAAVIGVTPQRIMVWFQNRRAKWRKSEKLRVKGKTKSPRSSAWSDAYGVPPVPDNAQEPTATLSVDTRAGNYTSLLSGPPSPLTTSSSASLVASMVASEAVPKMALPPLSSSRMEPFPSPPPIRRASLPLGLSFNTQSYIIPLVLDAHNRECSLSRQENGFREAYAYSIQNQGLSSAVSCNYPEQLEAPGNLETAYCQYVSQGGVYQLSLYPQQHQLSQFYHLPGHLVSNVLSGVRLTPTTPPEPQPAFLAAPANSRVMTYGAAGDHAQNPLGGQFLLQQPSRNSAGIPDYQAVPWNDFCVQEAPFSDQLCSQMPFSSTVGGKYFTEQFSYTQPPCLPCSPCFLQVANGTALGSMPHTGKQKGVPPPDQSLYQNLQIETELTSFAEREEVEGTSKKGEIIVDIQDENNNGCCTEEEN